MKSSRAQVVPREPVPWRDSERNAVAELVRTPWTLVIDSDEYLSEDAGSLLREIIEDLPDSVDALALPRRNLFFGSILDNERWYPDYQVRLFRTGKATWVSQHHVGAIIDGTVQNLPLDGPHIYHDAYDDLASFATKQMQYAVTDDYSRAFDPGEYVSSAMRMWMEDGEKEDLARAIDLILAWNDLFRCLMHWSAHRTEGEPIPAILQVPPVIVFTQPPTPIHLDENAHEVDKESKSESVGRPRSSITLVAHRAKRIVQRGRRFLSQS